MAVVPSNMVDCVSALGFSAFNHPDLLFGKLLHLWLSLSAADTWTTNLFKARQTSLLRADEVFQHYFVDPGALSGELELNMLINQLVSSCWSKTKLTYNETALRYHSCECNMKGALDLDALDPVKNDLNNEERSLTHTKWGNYRHQMARRTLLDHTEEWRAKRRSLCPPLCISSFFSWLF